VCLTLIGLAGVAAGQIIGAKNSGHLTAFGPVSETDGFPVWYKDDTNRKLEFCVDQSDPLCGFLPGDVPDETKPLSFPENWPSEIFYFLAGSSATFPGGGSIAATLGLEATFVNGEPVAGDQIVFGRVRFVGKGLEPGRAYTITHPYGVDRLTSDADGSLKFVEDVGIAAGQFGEALNSRIGPFLRWDPVVGPAAPAGYLGDPNVEHVITGSPYGTNLLKACVQLGAESDPATCAENDLFTVQGKYATNGGVEPTRATYSRSTNAGGTVDVFAGSDVGTQSIEVSGTSVDPTRLRGDLGHYVAHVDFDGPEPPASLKLSNVGDTPVSTKSVTVTDGVDGHATYDADSSTLTVNATSTDKVANPTLTASGYGTLAGGVLELRDVAAPLESVVVRSAAGGSASLPVDITGARFQAIPVQAFAGPDQQVLSAATGVTLDGSGSSGPIRSYSWEQDGGDPTQVTLTDAGTVTAKFDAPQVADDEDLTLHFRLTVTGAGGESTSTVKVLVRGSAPAAVANAGPDQTVDQDALVTLDASASTEATSYSWTQTAGPSVTLTGDTTAKPTFRAPKKAADFTFRVTARGAGGSSADAVTITTRPDVLTTAQVEYRRGTWRMSGTSNVFGPGVTVSIHSGATATGTPFATAAVDALGDWQFRGSAPVPGTPARVSLKSSSGGQLLNVPVTVRN